MNKNRSLGSRMKDYERAAGSYLPRRIPVIIRVDGKAFYTFTKGMKKPFDIVFAAAMQETMKDMCENIQGCVLSYTQSDEISLVLTDYATIHTDAWFEYNVQKMASIAASMATLFFNRNFAEEAEDSERYQGKLYEAMFDARVFSVPQDDVCNYLVWRQQDATRNSIKSMGQVYLGHKTIQGKKTDQVQGMLFKECGINWNDLPVNLKRGSCCIREESTIWTPDPRDKKKVLDVTRRKWVIDNDIPIFTQDRDYIDRFVFPTNDET